MHLDLRTTRGQGYKGLFRAMPKNHRPFELALPDINDNSHDKRACECLNLGELFGAVTVERADLIQRAQFIIAGPSIVARLHISEQIFCGFPVTETDEQHQKGFVEVVHC